MMADSSMEVIQIRQDRRDAGIWTELALSVSMQIGCWYTVLSMVAVSVPNTVLLPILLLFGTGGYLFHRFVAFPRWVSAVVAAICIVFILAVGRPVFGVIIAAAATAWLTGFGLKRGHALWALLATLVPVTIGLIQRQSSPDIWYFGLYLLCCCGLFAVRHISGRNGKKEDMLCLRQGYPSYFPAFFLFLILIVVLFYAFFFTPQTYPSFPAIERLRAAITEFGQTVTENTQEEEEEDISQGGEASRTQIIKSAPFWRKLLLWLLLIIVVACIAAAALYEIIMHRRLKKRKARWGTDFSAPVAFDMYRYIRDVMAFDGYTLEENPFCSAPDVEKQYDAFVGGNFASLAEAASRLRFGGDASCMTEEEHRSMRDYCINLADYVYHRQKRTGRFKMRFLRCYV